MFWQNLSPGDVVCLVSLPYLAMCGIFYYHLDNMAEKIIKESALCEDDENQLLWMINAIALPMFLLAPILSLFGIQGQLIHWLVWGKLEARNFPKELAKGG